MSVPNPRLDHLHPSCRKAMFRHAEGPVCRECRGEAKHTIRAAYNILKEAWAAHSNMRKYVTTDTYGGLCIPGREVWIEEDTEPMVCPYCDSAHCLKEAGDGGDESTSDYTEKTK